MDFLPPKNDFVFKRLFGDAQNTDILLAFLNSMLTDVGKAPLEAIELLNPNLDKQSINDKLAILDILVRSVNGDLINLEIQVINEHNMEKRTVFYWGELYTRQLEKGKTYTNLRRTITINILDFIYLPMNQAHSLYQIREQHSNHLLMSEMEIHFYELPKLKKIKIKQRTPLQWWGLFLQGIQKDQAEEFRMHDPMMKKAVDVLETLSQDKESRLLYDAREKAIHDEVSRLEYAQLQGRSEGEAIGEARGEARGRIEGIAQSIHHLWQKRFGKMSKKDEKALRTASSEALDHILDQMLEPQYTVKQARRDLGK